MSAETTPHGGLRYWLLLLLILLGVATPALAERENCLSCQIRVESLDEPLPLVGNWLFTREDNPNNKLPYTDTSEWKLVQAPGTWKGVYPNDETFRIGWYRGNFEFAPELLGTEAVLLLDAYMAKVQVYLDGDLIYQRQGQESGKPFWSIQPIPIRLNITQLHHVLTIRVDTILMRGVYQLPFSLHKQAQFDFWISFVHFWNGDLRMIAAYALLAFGIFFMMIYIKVRSPIYLVASLAMLTIFPFYGFPGDVFLTFFPPETMLILHYLGIGYATMFHCYYSQFFYKFFPRLNLVHALVITAHSLVFLGLTVWFDLNLFQVVRTTLFVYCILMAFHYIYMLVRGVMLRKPGALTVLIGEFCFVTMTVHDAFMGLGLFNSFNMTFTGSLIGFLAVLWVTSKRFATTYVQNKIYLKELEQKNRTISRQIDILHKLNEAGGKLAGLFDRDQVLNYMFKALRDEVFVKQSSLYLMEGKKLVLYQTFPKVDRKLPLREIEVGQGAIGTAAQTKLPTYIANTTQDEAFPLDKSVKRAEALLCVPLMDHDHVLGVLSLTADTSQFGPQSEERQVAETLSRFLAITLRNIQLMEDTRKTARMEAELQTAAAVQHALFPKELPDIPYLDFSCYFKAASETGGDWYGFVTEVERFLFIMIGDVTGHGTPAALVTATASATCRTLEELYKIDANLSSPANFLQYLNKSIFGTGNPNFLMTFFVARIDLNTGEVTFSNAGHNFPIVVRRDGSVKRLLNANVRLGHEIVSTFTENTFQLQTGDILFMFTDGLIENPNPRGEEWGERNLRNYLRHHKQLNVTELVGGMVTDVFEFLEKQPLEDDMTMVACKVIKPFPNRQVPNEALSEREKILLRRKMLKSVLGI